MNEISLLSFISAICIDKLKQLHTLLLYKIKRKVDKLLFVIVLQITSRYSDGIITKR